MKASIYAPLRPVASAKSVGVNSFFGSAYTCPELRTHVARPGATSAAEQPSRNGDMLLYRDGRVTDLQGQPLPAR